MALSTRPWSEHQVEMIVGNLLRYGVTVAAVVVFAGGILYLIRHGGASPDYRVFHGESADLRNVPGILANTVAIKGRGIIQLGLLLLAATPVARVALSVFAFALQRDRMYVCVTLIVLAVLLYSLVGSSL